MSVTEPTASAETSRWSLTTVLLIPLFIALAAATVPVVAGRLALNVPPATTSSSVITAPRTAGPKVAAKTAAPKANKTETKPAPAGKISGPSFGLPAGVNITSSGPNAKLMVAGSVRDTTINFGGKE
jgi:hypothetical protein